jgi:oxygen tolerance protein BatD
MAVAGSIFPPGAVWAGEPSLELTVDQTNVSPGEPVTAQVTVTGMASPPQPVLKNAQDFQTQGLGTSSQIQIINGKYSASKSFQFLLTPLSKTAGQFTIGPAEITVDGKTYQSDTVTVTVAKGEEPSTPSANPSAGAPVPGDKATFVTAEVSNANPYVNQEIVYTFSFFTRVPIRGSQVKPPDFSGFRKEQLGDVRHSQKVINGQTWDVSEVRWALFPVSSGEIEIGSTDVVAELLLPSRRQPFRDPFFGNDPFFRDPFFNNNMFQQTQRRQFTTDAIPIRVRPLPEEGKPSDFSGLVGTPRLSAQLSSRDVEVGESATLSLTVQGSGDVRDVPTPRLESGSDFKTYDDQPVFKSATGDQGLEGTKTFKKAVVPLRAGEITLPAFKLSFFDPKTGQYQTAATDPMSLHARPSSHPEANSLTISSGPETGKQGITPLSHDLMPIDRRFSALRSQSVSRPMRLGILLAALVPLLGFLAAWQWRRRLDRIQSDSGFLRREKAFKAAAVGIRDLGKASDPAFAERAAHVLRTFLSDKAGIDAGSLTPAEVDPRLEPLRVSPETRSALRKFLEACDVAVYGGGSVTSEMRRRLTDELKGLIERAGKEIRR